MLVLSRKKEEVIRIGDQIVITVCEIRGDKVRLGIEAPEHVKIAREELLIAVPNAEADSEGVDDVKRIAR